jgi:hypothetical protein
MEATLYTLSESSQFLKVRGGAAPEASMPLHIIALIDTSGSMELEGRLENVKRSLHFMFPMLGSTDLVSLISFDEFSQIHVMAQQMTADGLMRCQQALTSLKYGTATNMSAGLANVRTCLASSPATHKPAVMLLTDGEVNKGIREVAGLTNMVRDLRAVNPLLTVFATGYGLQHNANLLTEISTEGNGSYTIVQNQEHVAAVFGDILGGLLSCVAQNVEVVLPSQAAAQSRFRVIEGGGLKRVQLGDIYAEAEQVLIIENNPGPTSIHYLTPNGGIKEITPVVVAEAPEAIQQEFAATTVRLKVADILAAGRATPEVTISATIDEIRALAVQPAWAEIVIAELAALLAPIAVNPFPLFGSGGPALGATVSGAQQAAVLRMGRGLISQTVQWCHSQAVDDDPLNTAFMADPSDPTALPPPPPLGPPGLSQCFSSPTQRQVTGRLRQISSGVPAVMAAAAAATGIDSD